MSWRWKIHIRKSYFEASLSFIATKKITHQKSRTLFPKIILFPKKIYIHSIVFTEILYIFLKSGSLLAYCCSEKKKPDLI